MAWMEELNYYCYYYHYKHSCLIFPNIKIPIHSWDISTQRKTKYFLIFNLKEVLPVLSGSRRWKVVWCHCSCTARIHSLKQNMIHVMRLVLQSSSFMCICTRRRRVDQRVMAASYGAAGRCLGGWLFPAALRARADLEGRLRGLQVRRAHRGQVDGGAWAELTERTKKQSGTWRKR